LLASGAPIRITADQPGAARPSKPPKKSNAGTFHVFSLDTFAELSGKELDMSDMPYAGQKRTRTISTAASTAKRRGKARSNNTIVNVDIAGDKTIAQQSSQEPYPLPFLDRYASTHYRSILRARLYYRYYLIIGLILPYPSKSGLHYISATAESLLKSARKGLVTQPDENGEFCLVATGTNMLKTF
jgi:hypothetical protein